MPTTPSWPATLPAHLLATITGQGQQPSLELSELDLPGLLAALATLSDFRGTRGRRHALLPILVLAVWAVAAGASSYIAIADHARYATTEDLARIGIIATTGPTRRGVHRRGVPSMATIRRVLLGIDPVAFETALATWALGRATAADAAAAAAPAATRLPQRERRAVLSLEGKTVRGSRRRGAGHDRAGRGAAHRHRAGPDPGSH